MRHVLSVVGARPQFVKAAVVSRALGQAGLRESLIHTGQHYDEAMSGRFFTELGVPEPAANLGIGNLTHGAMTGRMLEGLEAEILERKPDWVLVYGDTNSTLAAALAAAKLHVRVAHVEAGLRSFNKRMPEEVNRVLTDHASDLLFAPTEAAVQNLRNEGIDEGKMVRTGDVMYDASMQFAELASGRAVPEGPFALATIHRAENTDDPERLRAIVDGLGAFAEHTPVVWPVHPRTRAAIERHGLRAARQLTLVDPVGYLDMIALERAASLILTDSGGVQKEAYFFRVPCLTLRDETEWVELVETGWNRLCAPTTAQDIVEAARAALGSKGQDVQLYGGGEAAQRVAECLAQR